MPNSNYGPQNGWFSIVHVETLNDGNINCLSAMVYDPQDSQLKAFYEARISRNAMDGCDSRCVSLEVAMCGLADTCRGTSLMAFEVAAVRDFIQEGCQTAGIEYPFIAGNDVDVKTLADVSVGPLAQGAVGLRQAAERLGIRTLPAEDAPSWGAVACWYVLRRIMKV